MYACMTSDSKLHLTFEHRRALTRNICSVLIPQWKSSSSLDEATANPKIAKVCEFEINGCVLIDFFFLSTRETSLHVYFTEDPRSTRFLRFELFVNRKLRVKGKPRAMIRTLHRRESRSRYESLDLSHSLSLSFSLSKYRSRFLFRTESHHDTIRLGYRGEGRGGGEERRSNARE